MKEKRFYIYEMTHESAGDTQFLFFPPDVDCRDTIYRLAQVRDMTKAGYELDALRMVSRDVYLNTRLEHRVCEYLANDNYEQYTKKRWRDREITDKVALETLTMIQEQKATTMKQIGMLIRRCQRYDYDIESEIALALYDSYLRNLRN